MNKAWLVNFTDTHLTILGMFLFIFVFLGSIIMVFQEKQKKLYSTLEKLPLELEATNESK